MEALLSWGLASVLGSSFAACAFLVLTQRWHGRFSLDHDLNGVQKIHTTPVPRVGGLGLAAGLLAGALVSFILGGQTYPWIWQLLLCATPAFAAGLIEDLTKKVSVRTRLYASFISAAMAIWVLGAQLLRLDTPVLDDLITIAPISILFTCFAVGGMTHAINIIDGLNGLAAGCVALMLAGLAAIAWQVGDVMVMKLCLWGVAALIGFLLLNFPFGRIFLGDGGAYLAGFWLAECAVLLLNRNPSVSTWAVLLCCIYPAWETVFSMYRRNMRQSVSSGAADMGHFHHLALKSAVLLQGRREPTWRSHSRASASLWLMVLVCQCVAVLSYNSTHITIGGVMAFVIVYQWRYAAMTRSAADKMPGTGQITANTER